MALSRDNQLNTLKKWGENEKKMTLYALEQVLFVFSIKFNILWVLDDIHHADPASLDFIQQITQGTLHSRLQIIFTHPPIPFDASLQKILSLAGFHHLIELKRLNPKESMHFLEKINTGDEPTQASQALITSISAGNPSKLLSLSQLSINPSFACFHHSTHGLIIKHYLQQEFNETEVSILQIASCSQQMTPIAWITNLLKKTKEQVKKSLKKTLLKHFIFIDTHEQHIGFKEKHVKKIIYKTLNPSDKKTLHSQLALHLIDRHTTQENVLMLWESIGHIHCAKDKTLFNLKNPIIRNYYYKTAKCLLSIGYFKEAKVCYLRLLASPMNEAESIHLTIQVATCSLYLDRYSAAIKQLKLLLKEIENQRHHHDNFIEATALLCKALSLESKYQESIDYGTKALRSMALDFLTDTEKKIADYQSRNSVYLKKTNPFNLPLDTTRAAKRIQTIKLINALLSAAYMINPTLYALLVNYAMHDFFKQGTLIDFPYLLITYALILQDQQKYLLAKELSTIALGLADERPSHHHTPTYATYYIAIAFWTTPYGGAKDYLNKAKTLSPIQMDNEYVFYTMVIEARINYIQQNPLLTTRSLLTRHLKFLTSMRIDFSAIKEALNDLKQVIQSFKPEDSDSRDPQKNIESDNKTCAAALHLFQIEQNIHFHEFDMAKAHLDQVKPIMGHIQSTPVSALYPFYLCLYHYHPAKPEGKTFATDVINEAMTSLAQLSSLCEENFKHRHLIVLALKAQHEEDHRAAQTHLAHAIALSKKTKFLRDTALYYRLQALMDKTQATEAIAHASHYYQLAGIDIHLDTLSQLPLKHAEKKANFLDYFPAWILYLNPDQSIGYINTTLEKKLQDENITKIDFKHIFAKEARKSLRQIIYECTPEHPHWEGHVNWSLFNQKNHHHVFIYNSYEKNKLLTSHIVIHPDCQQSSSPFNQRQMHAITREKIIGVNSAAIAHQLAQPLTAITSQIELILVKHNQSKNALLSYDLEKAKEALLDMGQLIHRLKKQDQTVKNTLSQAHIEKRLHYLMGLYKNDPIQLTVTIEPILKQHLIELDWIYFEQALTILINNSLEATEPNQITQVHLTCSWEPPFLKTHIGDEGPGISQDIRPFLFNSQYTNKENGTGIGLSLANAMLTSAHGTITLLDLSPGAHFEIKLPCLLQEQE